MKTANTASIVILAALANFAMSASADDNKVVGVYNYGVWSQEDCNVCTPDHGCGGTDPWCGTRQYLDGTWTNATHGTCNLQPIPQNECPGDPGVYQDAVWCEPNDPYHPQAWRNLPWGTLNDFGHLQPALVEGFYDNSDPQVVKKHIIQARANGIDYFNFYWYWDRTIDNYPDPPGGERFGYVNTFLAAPNTHDLGYAISIIAGGDSLPSRFDIPADQWSSVVTAVVGYVARPHYVRDGSAPPRPVVSFIRANGIGDGTHDDISAFLEALDAAVEAEVGTEPFIVMNIAIQGKLGATGVPIDLEAIDEVDGYSCLAQYGLASTSMTHPCCDGPVHVGSHATYNTNIIDEMDAWAAIPNGRPVIPCYMTAFDERPRTISHAWIHWCAMKFLIDWDISTTVHYGLSAIRNFWLTHDEGPVDDWVNLYAWNEWREAGHSLEPSDRVSGDANNLLDEVRSVFVLDTPPGWWVIDTCRIEGDCPVSHQGAHGGLDRADCEKIAGWARDWDTSIPVQVEIYKGNPDTGGELVATVRADLFRNDPNWPYISRLHGFSIDTPASFFSGQSEEVWVRALDIDVNGDNTTAYTTLNWMWLNGGEGCWLFKDGFESGNTSAWSRTCPPDCS